jgi:hypothetical protein
VARLLLRAYRRFAARRIAGLVGIVIAAWTILTELLIPAGEGIEHSSAIKSMDWRVTAFVVAIALPLSIS